MCFRPRGFRGPFYISSRDSRFAGWARKQTLRLPDDELPLPALERFLPPLARTRKGQQEQQEQGIRRGDARGGPGARAQRPPPSNLALFKFNVGVTRWFLIALATVLCFRGCPGLIAAATNVVYTNKRVIVIVVNTLHR